ncbi:prolipoprotein diacylglyceryl transferase [Acidiphilium acidophilum]|jgi:prolipoprotein diacylglyceryl transferase|uniref:Phosphatidylglycerol--prolipoprotein diacylglyceryl transferase n=1 Tax=Acidiphilium acidophilum TaxID=76588 RepID=A0AAW9DS11_ACIAO|nr:prolipoprotein diacylglyceryl transferase [Acidiphilium acidophilum]MDX5930852.1 prolipoprotein diacylglyceryl transferase [Acidiphilium acidophilum]MEE3501578.1 prolipoprotein diacylglyceryl transferase [Acidiphilium acidophilum]
MNHVYVWPHFDPILVKIGPFAIHYYALAYISALVLGWQLMRRLVRQRPAVATHEQVDDFLSWATLGVVLGGRIGYILFYQPVYFLDHLNRTYAVWDGGMSFHGGMIGVAVAILIYCHRRGLDPWFFGDRVAVPVPIGLFLGRIANFINGELWGRPAPAWFPFRMIYPQSGSDVPRYPSELIEATLEGLVLFVVLFTLSRSERIRSQPGYLAGVFVLGYGVARTTAECFRQPDWFLGYLMFGLTMGQLLSLPMIAIGIAMIWRAKRVSRNAAALPA